MSKRYPKYGYHKNLKPGLYLGLYHGFTSEKKRIEADDWASNGPVIGPLKFVHTTYAHHIKILFENADDAAKYGLKEQDMLTIDKNDNLPFGRMQYGGWTVFYHSGKE